jgi:hypothetical protein
VSEYQKEVQRLLRSATGKSDSDVALLEEAARLADSHGDVPLGLQVRIRMISSANFSGNHELVLVAFTWCLSQLDRDESLRARHQWNVLWYYKWVINSLSKYAQVSRQQLEQSFADMSNRYKQAGFGLSAIYDCRAYAMIRMGDLDAHREARALWMKTPRDGLSDCNACQTDTAASFDLEVGEFEKAVATAEPIIKGRQRCAEVPCRTFGRLLLPLLKLGQLDLAESLQPRVIRQTLSSRDFLSLAGEHAAYLAISGKFAKAIPIFETGMSWVMIVRRAWDRMLFLQGAVVLFERLATQGDEAIKVKIPASAPFYREDDTYKPSFLAQELEGMRASVAGELDRRNGNNFMAQRYLRYRELVKDIPI